MELKIKDKIVYDLEPLSSNFRNLNNNFSGTGKLDNQKVKIYSLPSVDQIELRVFVENTKISNFFPKILAYDNQYIVEDWIEGPTLKEKYPKYKKNGKPIAETDVIFNLINEMKTIKYEKYVFDYFSVIFERIGMKDHPLLFDIQKMSIPNYLCHNDLNIENIIVNKDSVKIIDNEHLGYNNAWILSLKNSFLPENNKDFYENIVDKKTIEKIWKIRKLWKI